MRWSGKRVRFGAAEYSVVIQKGSYVFLHYQERGTCSIARKESLILMPDSEVAEGFEPDAFDDEELEHMTLKIGGARWRFTKSHRTGCAPQPGGFYSLHRERDKEKPWADREKLRLNAQGCIFPENQVEIVEDRLAGWE